MNRTLPSTSRFNALRACLLLPAMLLSLNLMAQDKQPFRDVFVTRQGGQMLTLNLYEENIVVPQFEFLGPTNGYMHGNVYGVWFVTRSKVNGRTATMHLTNEFGSESQTVKLTLLGDTAVDYQAEGNLVIKRVDEGRKLVKLPAHMIFVRQHHLQAATRRKP